MSKLKDLFIQSDSTPAAPAVDVAAPIRKETFAPIATSVNVSSAPSPSTATSVMANEAVVATLWDAIIGRNLPGPDYLELKNNASALEDLPLSEEQRLSAAFKVLKKSYPQFTKDVILRSIDTYLGIVEEERQKGKTECQNLRISTVGEKEARLKQFRESAEEIRRQIKELEKQYEEANSSASSLEHEILTAKQDLETKEKMFESSVETVREVLLNDKTKIATLNF